MRIGVLCATNRGKIMLDRLAELLSGHEFFVFSFRETPWEPPFFDSIRATAKSIGAQFFEAPHLDIRSLRHIWNEHLIDMMFLINWRYKVPPSVYSTVSRGVFVFHDSLLPKYRGFSPTVWAIINGEKETGVTLFEIAEDIDSGDIIDQERVPIGPDETIREIYDRVTETYLRLLDRNLDRLLAGTYNKYPQDHSRATYACRRLPEDNEISWSLPSERIYNLIRAVSRPYPGAFTYIADRKLFVWSAKRVEPYRRYVGRIPGRVVEIRKGEGAVILTGDGCIELTTVQREGEKALNASEILTSLSTTLGKKLSHAT